MSQPYDTVGFYDDFAEHYHLVYADWDDAIGRGARRLDATIRERLPSREGQMLLLDCSCGIGTQAIGLARLGYRVHATDISPRAVERAAREADRLDAEVTFGVADMRELETQVSSTYNIIISCDNSVPHLITDNELRQALKGMRSRLRPGGLLLIGIRDYDWITQKKPRATPVRVLGAPPRRRFVFQAWEWAEDGRSYALDHLIVLETSKGWRIHHGQSRYRALLRDELESMAREAGFVQPVWHAGDVNVTLTAISP